MLQLLPIQLLLMVHSYLMVHWDWLMEDSHMEVWITRDPFSPSSGVQARCCSATRSTKRNASGAPCVHAPGIENGSLWITFRLHQTFKFFSTLNFRWLWLWIPRIRIWWCCWLSWWLLWWSIALSRMVSVQPCIKILNYIDNFLLLNPPIRYAVKWSQNCEQKKRNKKRENFHTKKTFKTKLFFKNYLFFSQMKKKIATGRILATWP